MSLNNNRPIRRRRDPTLELVASHQTLREFAPVFLNEGIILKINYPEEDKENRHVVDIELIRLEDNATLRKEVGITVKKALDIMSEEVDKLLEAS